MTWEKNTAPIKSVEIDPFGGIDLFSGTNKSEGTCNRSVKKSIMRITNAISVMILSAAVTLTTRDQDQNSREIGTTEENNTTKNDWNAKFLVE